MAEARIHFYYVFDQNRPRKVPFRHKVNANLWHNQMRVDLLPIASFPAPKFPAQKSKDRDRLKNVGVCAKYGVNASWQPEEAPLSKRHKCPYVTSKEFAAKGIPTGSAGTKFVASGMAGSRYYQAGIDRMRRKEHTLMCSSARLK